MRARVKEELQEDVARFARMYSTVPGLVIVRVGNDSASGVYSKAILRAADEVGLRARMDQLASRTTPDELRSAHIQLNNDVTVQGIIVQMPLPPHRSQKMVIDTI